MGEKFEQVRQNAIEYFFAASDEPYKDNEGRWNMNGAFTIACSTVETLTPKEKGWLLAEILDEDLDVGVDLSGVEGDTLREYLDDILTAVIEKHLSNEPNVALKDQERYDIFNDQAK